MQINELVTFAADVGRGLLESGAETSRVEDTVERIILTVKVRFWS